MSRNDVRVHPNLDPSLPIYDEGRIEVIIQGLKDHPEQLPEAYDALVHAMQSGVAADQNQGSRDGEPKHLRVGVNSALVECGAIQSMLVKKGLCTEEELRHELLRFMAAECRMYHKKLGLGKVGRLA